MHPVEIDCPGCGRETLLRREPVYEGFKRTGDKLSCSACGHVFADGAGVPFKSKRNIDLFDRKDIPPPPLVFKGDETARLCRHCSEYVVNPFIQRCSRLKKEVEATDTCEHFRPHETPSGSVEQGPAPDPQNA